MSSFPVHTIESAPEKDGRELDFFSTVTTLGTAQDITLQELRIECFHPANERTRLAARALMEDVRGGTSAQAGADR